ncbi:DUF4253 domain-containing protein [Kribbella sp. NPDC051770]|uniref:DUF4253 domain-containing protein n=1 Tax=Kribbella sp. NPDC051770 TaxID=3155413 RepID=UPI003415988E
MNFAARFPDLPPLTRLGSAASGAEIIGFATTGDSVTAEWSRLSAARAETGLHPVVLPPDFFQYAGEPRSADEVVSAAGQVDPQELLARLASYRPLPTTAGREGPDGIELAQQTDYAGPLGRDILRCATGLESGPDGSVQLIGYDVLLALVECAEPWHVFAHLGEDNETLPIDEHVAFLRYLHEQYRAVPASFPYRGLELVLGRPPATDEDAYTAAATYLRYNDGAYDLYDSDTVQNLAGKLKDNRVWTCWWD